MTTEQKERLDELTEWQGYWQRTLNALTSQMGRLANEQLIVSQETWDRLFQAEKNLRDAAFAVMEELEEAAKKAGVPGV
jgi:hypothetical protein